MNFILLFTSSLLLTAPNYYPKLYFLAWIGFLPLLFASRRVKGSGFKEGWFFGFFLTAFSSLFVYQSVELFTGLNFWIIAFFQILLYLAVALIYGFWFKIFLKLNQQKFSALYFSLSWLVLSFLRYQLLYFYPAGYLAVTQAEFSHFIQLAELGGFWLLTFVLLLVNAFFYQLIFEKKYRQLIYLLLIFLLIFSFGSLRLAELQKLSPEFPLGLITTNIIQDIKWDNEQIENNSQLMLAAASEFNEVDLIIAPETNITFDFGRKSNRKNQLLKEIERRFRAPLQFGTLSTFNGSASKFNSSFLISAEGEVLQRYNKNRLLYFGEKYPAETLINSILPYHFSSLLSGEESENFSNGNLSWKNAICSEILYSDYLIGGAKDADFIVNQTNEAWFQDSELLKNLMLSSAIIRAVENRRTVVKVGNLAHDALISPAGTYQLLPEEEIYQSRRIILNQKQTFYQRYYNLLELILWGLTAYIILIYFKKIRKN